MKWMIASDIHGSAYFCKKMVERFEKEGADKMLLLGDILYHGPRNDLPKEYAPKDVIALLNPLKDSILCVRGNCDAEVDQMVLDFPILSESMELSVDDLTIHATHGHHLDVTNLQGIAEGSLILGGHTHVPVVQKAGTCFYANPGSVSIPKEQSPHSYMILEDKCLIWKDLEGQEYMRFELLEN